MPLRKLYEANAGYAGWNRLVAHIVNAVRLDGNHALVVLQFPDDARRQWRGKGIQGVTVAVTDRNVVFSAPACT